MVDNTESITRTLRLKSLRRHAAEILYHKMPGCPCAELCKSCQRKVQFLLDEIGREGAGNNRPQNHID